MRVTAFVAEVNARWSYLHASPSPMPRKPLPQSAMDWKKGIKSQCPRRNSVAAAESCRLFPLLLGFVDRAGADAGNKRKVLSLFLFLHRTGPWEALKYTEYDF